LLAKKAALRVLFHDALPFSLPAVGQRGHRVVRPDSVYGRAYRSRDWTGSATRCQLPRLLRTRPGAGALGRSCRAKKHAVLGIRLTPSAGIIIFFIDMLMYPSGLRNDACAVSGDSGPCCWRWRWPAWAAAPATATSSWSTSPTTRRANCTR